MVGLDLQPSDSLSMCSPLGSLSLLEPLTHLSCGFEALGEAVGHGGRLRLEMEVLAKGGTLTSSSTNCWPSHLIPLQGLSCLYYEDGSFL